MDSAKSQLIDRLKTANSVLITVSRNPSVDQLAACIGLALLVNKLGKHGSAVFSGEVPSTIEFLKPEKTFEKNADSLRDFIIALDKNKADKLRYKVEDQMVKIFITPYKTSLSEKDLEFTQGDFNVELVVALGVKKQEDLDEAIITHGRILHDATVACINIMDASNLGTISWQEPTASSLCELVADLASLLGDDHLDEQISTALLTGIIAETERFSNEKTTSQTMSVSAKLMAAGANQQLVATNLVDTSKAIDSKKTKQAAVKKPKQSDDGTLSIKHNEEETDITTLPIPKDIPVPKMKDETTTNQVEAPNPPRLVTEPPILGGTLTANSIPEQYDPSTDPLSNAVAQAEPILTVSGDKPMAWPALPPAAQPAQKTSYTPPPPTWAPPAAPEPEATDQPNSLDGPKSKTLNQIEKAVGSPHVNSPDLSSARNQVEAVLASSDNQPKADEALNAIPLGDPIHEEKNKAVDSALSEIEQIHKSTGLDPSLFSDPPPKEEGAPPVPPPIQYPLKPSNGGQDNNPAQ